MNRLRFILTLLALVADVGVAASAEKPLPQSRAESNERQANAGDPLSRLRKITVRGVCSDERGAAVAGARVRIFRYPSQFDVPLLVADLRADAEGKFSTDDLDTAIDDADFAHTGDVCVAATAERHVSAIRWINQETLLAAAPAIDPFAPPAAARQQRDIVELSLELHDNPGTLSGTVTDESGRPVSGVTVFLPMPTSFQQPLPGVRSAVTDEAGRYSIADLNPWTAGQSIRGARNAKEQLVVTSSVFLLDHPDYARTIAHNTAVPQTVNVILHPPAILEGAVVDAVAHRPAANVIVSAQGVARNGWYQTRADRQGRYRLRMTKDHYNIWAEAEDRIPIAAKAIKAEPGKTVSVADIPLVRGGFVTGRVTEPATNHQVAPPLRVAHYGPARPRTGAAVTFAEVNADGTYRLRVAPGINYIYHMTGRASQVVSVEDGQEVKVDLEPGNRANNDAFADDIRLAATLLKQAEFEDAEQESLAKRGQGEPIPKLVGRQRGDTPTARLLDKLEAQNAGEELFKDSWCRTLKEIVDLGPPAVPELIAELDATDNDRMLRCLGFTLRAIGDKRAVPALIRAIPKTLLPPGSDMGLRSDDAELLKFAQQHDVSAQDRDGSYSFGRPVREIFAALQKLTGERRGEEQLFHIFLDGLSSQRRMKRELYQRSAQAWADWWEKTGAKQLGDAAYLRVTLPPLVAAEPKAPPPPGMHFKVDSGSSNWLLESVLNPKSRTVFYDFDTGRVSDLPEKWREAKNIEARLDEIIAWARQDGFDLMGSEYVSPDGGPNIFSLRSIDLRTWELGENRWKMQSDDITLEALQAEGTPAGDLLLHRDKESKAFDPRAIASFLYITSEGTPGLLFVGIEVQDDSLKPGGRSEGDNELKPIAFRKGRRFGFKNFTEAKPAEDQPR
jgi:hypothetical protein